MKVQDAHKLIPTAGEITQIQTLNENKKIQDWSIYLLDGKYNLVKGKIFHHRQNHIVFMSNKTYASIANFLMIVK